MKAPWIFSLAGSLIFPFLIGCHGQTQNKAPESGPGTARVGGDCESGYCDLMYVGMPKVIHSADTSEGWFEKGQKLVVTGTVFQIDGKTPAPDVILYYHHTDQEGYYSPGKDKTEKQTRHGRLRGWIKTDQNGKYALYTLRPAPYPNEEFPAHIHWIIREPDLDHEYWIDDLVFDDDPLLIPFRKKHPFENRAGSGIGRVLLNGDQQMVEHDFILGLNIPNYPANPKPGKQSGLSIGEDQPSFAPFHAYGPDRGSRACPVCKYGRYHGILYFVGNRPDWTEIKTRLQYLELESGKRQNELKAYFVYGNDQSYTREGRQRELEQLGRDLNIKKLALTFVPSFSDTQTEAHLNRIDPGVENTFILYKHRRIIDKFINLKPTSENFSLLSGTLDKTRGDYFHLPEPKHE